MILTSPGKCAGCNKCIARCPSPDANSSVLAGDSSFVSVDPLRCIACGACLRACDHDARYFEDDTEAFFADLARGTPISVVVAPAVRANFPRPELLLGFLKSQGVRLAFDVSFGADITTWAYLKVIGERGLDSVIAQPCPAIVNYIERYLPDLIGRLAPVHSPMMASAIYLRRYLNATERIAFLSPCVAKSDEIRAAETGGLVSYNVTFSGLLRYLERRRARLEESSPAGYDDLGCGLGLLYSRPGGLRECVEHVAPGAWVRQIEGPERAYPYLHAYGERLRAGKPVPLLVDILSCADGCNLGPGTTGEAALDDIDATFNALKASRIAQRDGWLRKPASLLRYFEKSLRVEDFQRSYRSRAEEISRTEPGAAAIAQAFAAMRKQTPESRSINCTACGYQSCRRMAVAIARGLNHPGNCIYFTREEMKSEKAQIEQAHASLQQSNARIGNSVAEMTQALESLAGSNQAAVRTWSRSKPTSARCGPQPCGCAMRLRPSTSGWASSTGPSRTFSEWRGSPTSSPSTPRSRPRVPGSQASRSSPSSARCAGSPRTRGPWRRRSASSASRSAPVSTRSMGSPRCSSRAPRWSRPRCRT